jgi:hypothetical protein
LGELKLKGGIANEELPFAANGLLKMGPSEPLAEKVKEAALLLAGGLDALGDGGRSEGLETKPWLVCLKKEARLRSLLSSCPES